MAKRELVVIENTKFIFRTNFGGKADNDKYGSTSRRGNLIIPTEQLAEKLSDLGMDVKCTRPKEGEEEGFKPTFFIPILIKYDSAFAQERPPKVYLVAGEGAEPVLLNEDNVGIIDMSYILNVDATIEIAYLKNYDRHAAYVRTMYVTTEADDDPFASKYASADEVHTMPSAGI